MRDKITVRRLMLLLTVLGIILASYLVYVHYSGSKPICTASTACLKVQTSQWSKLAGVPVALIGLIGYIAILISLVLPDTEGARTATLGMLVVGVAFSGYLTYRELFSIHEICEECATSAVFQVLLLIGAGWRFWRAPSSPVALPDPPPQAAPADRITTVRGPKQPKKAGNRQKAARR